MTMLFDHANKTGLAPAPVDEHKAFDYYETWKLFVSRLSVRKEQAMKLVDFKCPNCGSGIKADTDSRTATCEYCGSAFAIDDE